MVEIGHASVPPFCLDFRHVPHANISPPAETKFFNDQLIRLAEQDSSKNPMKYLKDKLEKRNPVADTILADSVKPWTVGDVPSSRRHLGNRE
jgi:hypothetical protein